MIRDRHCLLLWSQLGHQFTGSGQNKQTSSFLLPDRQKNQRFLQRHENNRAVKYSPHQQQEVGSWITILPECLFHWQWYSWTHCRLLFWGGKKDKNNYQLYIYMNIPQLQIWEICIFWRDFPLDHFPCHFQYDSAWGIFLIVVITCKQCSRNSATVMTFPAALDPSLTNSLKFLLGLTVVCFSCIATIGMACILILTVATMLHNSGDMTAVLWGPREKDKYWLVQTVLLLS